MAPFSRWPVYERVLVNLTDGSAMNGLLVAKRGDLLVLTDVTLLEENHEPVELDGDVYIERFKIRFLQTHGPV
jgi:small nuclear ribonucleoprotein (snRNP)-like protein